MLRGARRNTRHSRLHGWLFATLTLVATLDARGAELPWQGTLSIGMGTLGRAVTTTGVGVSTVNSSGVGGVLSELRLTAGSLGVYGAHSTSVYPTGTGLTVGALWGTAMISTATLRGFSGSGSLSQGTMPLVGRFGLWDRTIGGSVSDS